MFPFYDECSTSKLHSYFTQSLNKYLFKRTYSQRVCDFGRSLTASISDFQVHRSMNCLVQLKMIKETKSELEGLDF